MCTPVHVREGVVRYPQTHRSKLLLVGLPHLTQRGIGTVFSTDLEFSVLHLIMTETVFWTRTSSEACGRYSESILGQFWVNSEVNTGPQLSKTGPQLSKTGPQLSKTCHKTSLNPVKRPCKH